MELNLSLFLFSSLFENHIQRRPRQTTGVFCRDWRGMGMLHQVLIVT